MKNMPSVPNFSGGAQADVQRTAVGCGEGHQLAGTFVHEFNNLLVPIVGYAEMADDALRSGSSSHVYVDRIRRAGERARRVVEEMLDSSIGHGEIAGSFDATTAIEEIRSDLQMCIPPYVQLQVNLPGRAVWLEGSALCLQQTIINLCKNAGEAMKAAGRVTVTLHNFERISTRSATSGQLEPGEYARLSVTDTGPGIPHVFLDRIFEPFFTTKSEAGGSGLGLALVLHVVKARRGAINVNSTQGLGTTFELFFPRASCGINRVQKNSTRVRHSS